jgi:response regulator of citrate/malate metabolism
MPETLNVVLLVEDDENDIIITKRKIAKSSLVINEIIISRTLKDTISIVHEKKIDLIILDLNLPDSQGIATLDSVLAVYSGIVIVITSIDDELIGVEAIRHGADDYIVKNQLTDRMISQSVYYSIERRKTKQAMCKAQETISKLENIMKP